MSSFTAQRGWIMIGIIVVMLISFFCRYPAPLLCGGDSADSEALSEERLPFAVEIAGGVSRPGIYCFPRQVCVARVIQAAGGLKGPVSLSPECLRGVLQNGSMISIGLDGAPPAVTLMDPHKRFLFFVPLAVNQASAEELAVVPGIGEKTAKAIVSYRDRHGCFPELEALLRVPGIGPRTFERIKDYLVP